LRWVTPGASIARTCSSLRSPTCSNSRSPRHELEHPPVQIEAADAQRVLDALAGTGDEAIERNGDLERDSIASSPSNS
jgi:hypothetical protein